MQLIGPSSVKWSLGKAGELGRAMSEDEILDSHFVSELMIINPVVVKESAGYAQVMESIKHSEYVYFPVVDNADNFKGAIQLDNVRSILFEEGLEHLIRAADMVITDVATISPEAKLSEAKDLFDFEEYDYLPVLDVDKKLLGVLPRRRLKKFLKRKMWESEVG